MRVARRSTKRSAPLGRRPGTAWTTEIRDPPVSERGEVGESPVAHGGCSTQQHRRPVGQRPVDEHRPAIAEHVELAVQPARRHHDEPVHGRGQRASGTDLLVPLLARIHEEDLQVGRAGGALHGAHERREVRVGDVRHDHGEVAGATGDQPPSRPVGHEAERGHRLGDPGPGRGGDTIGVAQRAGDRAGMHPGTRRDVEDRRPPAVPHRLPHRDSVCRRKGLHCKRLLASAAVTPLALHPDRLLPPEPAASGDRPGALRGRGRPSADLPARPRGPALVRRRRAVPRPGPAAHRARPLPDPDALQPGRAARGPRRAAPRDGGPVETDGRDDLAHVRRRTGTCSAARPSRLWLEQVLADVFGVTERLAAETADAIYDRIAACLAEPEFRPRALFDRFGIEVLATTESPLDDLRATKLAADGWSGPAGGSSPTFRPDDVVDPEQDGWADRVEHARRDHRRGHRPLGRLPRRAVDAPRRVHRARAPPPPTTATRPPHTVDLPAADRRRCSTAPCAATATPATRKRSAATCWSSSRGCPSRTGWSCSCTRAPCATTTAWLHARFGRDVGGDIPAPTNYVDALRPLLDRFGNDRRLPSRAVHARRDDVHPRAGPARRRLPRRVPRPAVVVPRQPRGLRRFREPVTETAGFANTAGFVDDTRAFCSIPARHDVARRVDAASSPSSSASTACRSTRPARSPSTSPSASPRRVFNLDRDGADAAPSLTPRSLRHGRRSRRTTAPASGPRSSTSGSARSLGPICASTSTTSSPAIRPSSACSASHCATTTWPPRWSPRTVCTRSQ